MYKRRARILFFCEQDICVAKIAEAFANTLGSQWLEAKSAGLVKMRDSGTLAQDLVLEEGIRVECCQPVDLVPDLLSWPDLLVVIGPADLSDVNIPGNVRKKNWPLTTYFNAIKSGTDLKTSYLVAKDELKYRVTSMINGMKMLSKSV